MSELSSRDLELLSAYLDGQLSQADGARLESRIKSDPELRSVYDGLRQTRALLRKLPARRAPRNFRLTPQMVGIKQRSIPRSFPIFRLTSVLASILLFLGYAINIFSPVTYTTATQMYSYDPYAAGMAPAPTEGPPQDISPKMPEDSTAEEPLNTEATATTEESMMTVMAEPTETLQVEGTLVAETMSADAADSARSMLPAVGAFAAAVPTRALPIQQPWLFGLLGLAVISGAGAFIVRRRGEGRLSKLTTREFALIALGLIVAILIAFAIYWLPFT